MNKFQKFIDKMKDKSEEEKHILSFFLALILTSIVALILFFSWYLEFYDLPIENTLLTKIVSWF